MKYNILQGVKGKNINKRISDIKDRIAARDFILNGTLIEQYKQCGKSTCRCYDDRKYWHGPYWIWTRKEKGKTITKTLSKAKATMVKKAIREMKIINSSIEKWRALSLKEIEKCDK